jgi:hypothetical protein
MFGGHRPPHWETHKRLWWAVPIPQMLCRGVERKPWFS